MLVSEAVREKPSPFDSRDEEHQVAIDLGAVDKLVDVAGVHGLSRLQTRSADAITRCTNKPKKIRKQISQNAGHLKGKWAKRNL